MVKKLKRILYHDTWKVYGMRISVLVKFDQNTAHSLVDRLLHYGVEWSECRRGHVAHRASLLSPAVNAWVRHPSSPSDDPVLFSIGTPD